MKGFKKHIAIIMLHVMAFTIVPVISFAEEEDDCGYEEISFEQSIVDEDISDEMGQADELYEDYIYKGVKTSSGIQVSPKAVIGDRLTGNNLKYYNYYKNVIKNVDSGKQSNTVKKVSLKSYLGKRKFTAKELGVSRIGYKSKGKWYLDSKAKKKIQALFSPEDWKKIYQALTCDLSSEGYWVNWHSGQMKYDWSIYYSYNAKSLTFNSSDYIEFSVPVIPEFAKSASSSSRYIYQADLNKIKSANSVKNNAKQIVRSFDEAAATTYAGFDARDVDYLRLEYYCKIIDKLAEYDHYSANLISEDRYWRAPWSMAYVFDGDVSTKVVCAGYARAYKYLCDLSDFRSDWIECSIVTGSAGSGENASHMWNIVRMNDGLNYVVDPTWTDNGDDADLTKWFLRGAPSGTSDYYIIEGNKRVYDEFTKVVLPAAERKLSTKDRYEYTIDRTISLKSTRISKLTKDKKAFTVKWKKVSTPIGALYIDGYQIQYSLKKNFKSPKTVNVKGYNSASKKISKLKSKKTYYVRIRTFAKLGNRTYYSTWSPAKKVKTK